MSRGPTVASPTPGLSLLRTLLRSGRVSCRHPHPTCIPSESVGPGAGPGPDAAQPGPPTNKTSMCSVWGWGVPGTVCPSDGYFLSMTSVPGIALGA